MLSAPLTHPHAARSHSSGRQPLTDVRRTVLVYLLQRAGFAQPEASIFNQSRIPDVALIELEVRAREKLYVESVK